MRTVRVHVLYVPEMGLEIAQWCKRRTNTRQTNLYRHPRESGDLRFVKGTEIPAFAGMTTQWVAF
jgi:hypothetical protein